MAVLDMTLMHYHVIVDTVSGGNNIGILGEVLRYAVEEALGPERKAVIAFMGSTPSISLEDSANNLARVHIRNMDTLWKVNH